MEIQEKPVVESVDKTDEFSRKKLFGKLPDPPNGLLLAGLILASILANIAMRVNISLAAFLSVSLLVVSLFSLRQIRNNLSYITGGLIVLTSLNFILRSSDLVLFTSVVSVLVLGYMLVFQVFGKSISIWFVRGVETIVYSIKVPLWLVSILPKKTGSVKVIPIIRGLVIASVVTIPVVILLASADEVFASLFNPFSVESNLIGHAVLTLFFLAVFFVVAFNAARDNKFDSAKSKLKETKSYATEKLMVLLGLTAILGVWCAVQSAVAAGGADQIFTGNDLTRAEYARSGFFQLVTVAAIVIAVINGLNHFTKSDDGRSSLMKALQILLVIETAILVVVSFSRMRLYMDAFGLTLARLFVTWFLVWLLVLLFIYGLRLIIGANFGSSIPLGFLSAGVFVMLFGFSNPENTIVESNIDRAANSSTTDDVDMRYLFTLSEDAVPALVDNVDPKQNFVSKEDWYRDSNEISLCNDVKIPEVDAYGVLGWNKSRSDARQLLGDLDC